MKSCSDTVRKKIFSITSGKDKQKHGILNFSCYFCSPKNGEVAQVVRAQDS